MDALSTPKPFRLLTLAASAVGGLAAAACLYVALVGTSEILWGSVGFLVIMLIAALLGIAAGVGRFSAGFGMACVAIAMTIVGGAVFAWRDLASNVGRDPSIGPKLLPWLGLETICAIVILLAGGAAVLSREPRSWGSLIRGLAFLIPAGILLAVGSLGWSKIPTEDGGRAIALGVLLAGGAILGVLVSIGGHHLIRAFEITTEGPAKTQSS